MERIVTQLFALFPQFLLGAWAVAVTFAFAYYFRRHRLGVASREWPHTQGTVTHSSIEVITDSEGTGRRTHYSAKLKYAYEADGKVYQGNTFTYRVMDDKEGTATNIVKSLPEGQPVDVYYDPSKPSRAVLLPGPNTDGADRVFFVFLAVIAVIVLLMILCTRACW